MPRGTKLFAAYFALMLHLMQFCSQIGVVYIGLSILSISILVDTLASCISSFCINIYASLDSIPIGRNNLEGSLEPLPYLITRVWFVLLSSLFPVSVSIFPFLSLSPSSLFIVYFSSPLCMCNVCDHHLGLVNLPPLFIGRFFPGTASV